MAPKPTKTEKILKQSLPPSLRNLPVAEVRARQSIPFSPGSGRGGSGPSPAFVEPPKPLPPPPAAVSVTIVDTPKVTRTGRVRTRSDDAALRSAQQRSLAFQKANIESRKRKKAFELERLRLIKKGDVKGLRKLRGVIDPRTRLTKERAKLKRDIDKLTLRVPKISIAKARTKEILDIATGGTLSQRRILKSQVALNVAVQNFNKKFGDQTLTEVQASIARKEAKLLEARQKQIESKLEKLAKTKRVRVGKFLGIRDELLTKKQKQQIEKDILKPDVQARIRKSLVPVQKDLKKTNKQLKEATGLRKTLLNIKKDSLQNRIEEIGTGRPQIAAGSFPIIPASQIPRGVNTVAFIGRQKVRKGKIITDIAFRTSRGEIGRARGVTLVRDGKGFSVIAGRSGKVSVKIPSGKRKVRKIKSFIAREEIQISKEPFRVVEKVRVGKRKEAQLRIIRQNLRAVQQRGIGQIASVRGRKFISPRIRFPTGKVTKRKKKRINLEDFASISAIFNKGDINLIIGKSITRSKDKSNFIGILRGEKNLDRLKLTGIQRQQFQKAFQQVISSTSAALAKADKTKGITKATRPAVASSFLRAQVAAPARIIPTTKKAIAVNKSLKKVNTKVTSISKELQASQTKTQSLSATLARTTSKSRQKLLSKQQARQKQKQQQLQKALVRQKALQRLRLKQLNKLVLKPVRVPRVPRIPRGAIRLAKIPIPRVGKKARKVKIKKRRKTGFNVLAKPVKGKRLVKVNIRTLTRAKAKDLRNFVVDTSLSRTGRIKATKRRPKKPKIKTPKSFAALTKQKFRDFRIVKGKRVPLTKGTVIEKKKRLLDTIQERRKITLRRRIKQLQGPKRKVKKVRKTRKRRSKK